MKTKSQVADGFDLGCVACGVAVRRDKVDDSPRICLRCYYMALNQRLLAQRRARAGKGTSDR